MIGRRRLLGAGVSLLAAGAGCSPRRAPAEGAARRVVSVSPSTTEALFAVGAGASVVGRSRFCDYPPEARALPSVGDYASPNLEAILGLLPDLVVGEQGPAGPSLREKLEARGVATFFPPTGSMREIDAMVLAVAGRVGRAAEGQALGARMQAERARISALVAGERRPRVLFLVGLSPIFAAGPGSFGDELLGLSGADNALGTARAAGGSAYPVLDIERVLALDPDVVLNSSGMSEAAPARLGPGWAGLRAVREGRLIALTSEAVLRPGPRIAAGLAEVARALHPGVAL